MRVTANQLRAMSPDDKARFHHDHAAQIAAMVTALRAAAIEAGSLRDYYLHLRRHRRERAATDLAADLRRRRRVDPVDGVEAVGHGDVFALEVLAPPDDVVPLTVAPSHAPPVALPAAEHSGMDAA